MGMSSKEILRPAMVASEISLYTKYISNCSQYFEYGIGGSTVFASDNSNAIIRGVDSSQEWINKVTKLTDATRVKLCHVDIGPIGEWGNPKGEDHKNLWPGYSSSIFNTDIKPDFILVDGRFRVACIIQSIIFSIKHKINPIISLHDCNRVEYKIVQDLLQCIDRVDNIAMYQIEHDKVNVADLHRIYNDFKFICA